MVFFFKKRCGLLFGLLLLTTNLYAACQDKDETAVMMPYGVAAYEKLLKTIADTKEVDELRTVVKIFVNTYKKDLTLPAFYSFLSKAEEAGKISSTHFEAINGFVRDWVCQGKQRRAKTINPEDVNNTVIPSSNDIKRYLSERVIGEEKAMQSLAVTVGRHLQIQLINQMFNSAQIPTAPLKKTNILLVGPTGSGKTASVQHLANLLKVPFFAGDASTFTRTGYVGDSVGSMVEGLLKSCKYDVKKAQRGIIFIDELDKIAAKNTEGRRDITGDDVQSELLKLIEGKDYLVKQKLENAETTHTVNTSGILFIGGGAFTNLPKKPGADYTFKDLVDIGMKPELMGRFSKIICLEGMTKEKLGTILRSPTVSPIAEAKILMRLGYKITVTFDEAALDLIAQKAYELGTGARGLTSIVNQVLEPIIDASSEYSGKTVTIDASMIPNEPLNNSADLEPWKTLYM